MPAEPKSNTGRGYAVGVLSAVILCTTSIFIKHLSDAYRMPPLVLAFWRDAFVVVTLVAALATGRRPGLLRLPRGQVRYLVGYGFVLAVFNSFLTFSVAVNGAAVSTVLVNCSAAFTALLGRFLLGERLGWAKAVALALSIGGCVLVTGATSRAAWQTDIAGIATGILSGLAYAAYSLMGRKATSQYRLNPWTTILYTFGFAGCFLLTASLVPWVHVPGAAKVPADLFCLGASVSGWVTLFALAAGPTLVGFGLYNVTLSLLPSSVANLLLTLEVPFTAVVAYLTLGELLTVTQIAGGLLVLAGVVLLRVSGELGRGLRVVIEPRGTKHCET